MTKLTKVLLGLAAAVTVLAATGCCLPHHGGRHGHWDRQSHGHGYERLSPPMRPAHASRWP